MSKRDSAPTVGWLISSRVYKWLVFLVLAGAAMLGLYYTQIRFAVKRDCIKYHTADYEFLTNWIHVEIGSTEKGCPAPYVD